MAESIVGIVEEVINNGKGKGSGVRINGSKYGVYDPAAANMDAIEVGMNVSLRYTEKDGGGGVKYKNVQGRITPVKGDVAATAPPAPAGGGVVGGREQAIIRQNALTNAVNYAIAKDLDGTDTVIRIAQEFEEYTSGALKNKENKKADAEMEEAFNVMDA